jgi:hypothetical protein
VPPSTSDLRSEDIHSPRHHYNIFITEMPLNLLDSVAADHAPSAAKRRVTIISSLQTVLFRAKGLFLHSIYRVHPQPRQTRCRLVFGKK